MDLYRDKIQDTAGEDLYPRRQRQRCLLTPQDNS